MAKIFVVNSREEKEELLREFRFPLKNLENLLNEARSLMNEK